MIKLLIAAFFVYLGVSSFGEYTILSFIFFFLAIALVITIFPSNGKSVTYHQESQFNDALNSLKASGKKVTYANKNTGTISCRNIDGTTESYSVYQGYNSHYKRRTK